MTEPTTTPEPGCALCVGLSVVTYAMTADHRPSPFCGRCGREIPLRLVMESPADPEFRHGPRRATP